MNYPKTPTLANSIYTLEAVAKLKKTILVVKASGLEVPYEMTFKQGYVTYRALNFMDNYQFHVKANADEWETVESNWLPH